MDKLLLHVCCGPCGVHSARESMKDHLVTMYFYNPNIHPYGEYLKRLESAKIVADDLGLELIEGEYDAKSWLADIAGLEEEPEGYRRCTVCFSVRLTETARKAAELGFDSFTTTMTLSPHKNAERINRIGAEQGEKQGVTWVHSDFKKKHGTTISNKLSDEMGLYRQRHCGCFFSEKR